ncbi:hypothetical protein SOPP22_16220 [Shewanella sp. OPT22]|nr:hypothetical protein SOPP22_16220 [Shewanella sp. OPT22]
MVAAEDASVEFIVSCLDKFNVDTSKYFIVQHEVNPNWHPLSFFNALCFAAKRFKRTGDDTVLLCLLNRCVKVGRVVDIYEVFKGYYTSKPKDCDIIEFLTAPIAKAFLEKSIISKDSFYQLLSKKVLEGDVSFVKELCEVSSLDLNRLINSGFKSSDVNPNEKT